MNDQTATCENTDREIWRGPDEGNGSYYADSIHVTRSGGIGINVAGHVIVMPLRDWHRAGGERKARECMGRKQSLPEPGECNWPDCGCDPHATKVIEALLEQGWTGPALSNGERRG